MDELHVVTWEADGASLRLLGRHASFAASAEPLPRGAYTTFRTYGERGVVRLAQHLRRLEQSVALQGLPGALDAEKARRAVGAALDTTRHRESRVRLTFSPPRLFVAVEPFSPLPHRLYEEGAACVTLRMRRENPHAKDTRFIAAADGAYRRLPPGVEEGLLVAEDGDVLEGLSSNFFAVVGGTLRTEEERALLGVTRSLVLEVAQSVLPIERLAVPRDALAGIEEAFITSVSRGVLPVVRIDDQVIGSGRPGEKTRAIMAGFAALVARETETL
jgi:branched-chain amino acid aminotransferase